MRYLFKRLDQQTTTTAHPQWAMGTHRSAPCPHLDGLVTDMDALFFYEFPLKTGKFAAAWAKKRQFSALTAKFGLEITFSQQLDVRGGY